MTQMTIKKIKTKDPEQRILEKDLLSPKYRTRREKSVKHYDRNKQRKDWIKEDE